MGIIIQLFLHLVVTFYYCFLVICKQVHWHQILVLLTKHYCALCVIRMMVV